MSIDASILEEFGAGYTPPVDEDRKGYYVTDMAEAEKSYGWGG